MAIEQERLADAKPALPSTPTGFAPWSKRKGWPLGSCRYCGRLLLGPHAPVAPPVYSKGYEFCNDLEAFIYDRDGCLSPERKVANEAAVAQAEENAKNVQRQAREREAMERELQTRLRTL